MGCAAREWRSLATALPQRLSVRLPGVLRIPGKGWQHDAFSFVEKHFLNSSIWLLLGGSDHVTSFPEWLLVKFPIHGSAGSRFDSDLFRVLLLRRLRLLFFSLLSVWPSTRLPWPPRRKLLEVGVLGRCGHALESGVSRRRSRVSTNILRLLRPR